MMTMEEYSRAKTSVWWDIENCEVPKGWDAHAIAQNVASALLNMNYCGTVSILAYGDTNLIPHHVQQALSSTGVGLNHVPAGVKDASDKKILVDMLLWAVDNPAPANIMLISGDRDFSNALHQLSMRRYTILLAQPPRASAPLVSAAKNVWLWTSLASGGPPLTSGEESSQQVNNGRCNGSYPVSEPSGSSSVAGDTNVTSSNSFRAHLSDKRQTPQAAFVASPKAHASASAKPIQETHVVEPVLCVVCQISCANKEAYANHIYGKKHRNNLELQSGKVENMSKKKARRVRTRPNAGYACRLCNVKCQTQVVYDSHLKGQKHAAMLSKLDQSLIAFNKLQKKSVGEKSQPRETIAEPQLQSPNTQGNTKWLEKQSKELKELLLGTSESRVKEKLSRTKDQGETVKKQLLSEEARECSEGATDNYSREMKKKQKEVMEHRAITPISKLCHLCVVICDSQGVSTLVCDSKYHWTNQKAAFVASDDAVWCSLCQISFNSKAAYANHTNGKKHLKKLKLQSAKNENMSKGQAKISEENAERMKKSKDQTAFDSQNHVAMVKDQTEALIDSKKLQEKGVGEKSKPREVSPEPQFQSQDSEEKHVAIVNQSEALPIETIAEPKLQSPNTQEKTKCFEKQTEELKEILFGASERSVEERLPRTKDQAETNKHLLNEEARECYDDIVKPVNQSEVASDNHSVEVKKKEVMECRAVRVRHKLCHLCVVICDSQGVSTLVCGKKYHWPNQMAAFEASDDSVWCQVCQISCNNRAAYENHTNGKKHLHKLLESQSAKNENMSKGQAKLSEENTEKMKKSKDQTAYDSQNHAAMVKDKTEEVEQARKESDQGEQEVKEEVKEINAVSENLVHVFNGMNRESRTPKEPRGCLDVIPERVLVPPDVNVTAKFEDESKHKTEKECAGGKEHLGEAAKREESKTVQVDNLWTRLWWGKS